MFKDVKDVSCLENRHYHLARHALLWFVIVSFLDLCALVLEWNIGFTFTAIIPQLSLLYGWLLQKQMSADIFAIVGYAIAILFLLGLLFCFFYSRKKATALKASFILVAVDSVFLIYWIYLGLEVTDFFYVFFHLALMAYMFHALKKHGKILDEEKEQKRKLREEKKKLIAKMREEDNKDTEEDKEEKEEKQDEE
jgi:signal transduction histidine kinase